ncbi:Fcf1-domain-containing protein [Syncephalastrum racemosum]|uniref:U three protein 23 n=1 Tax=Syncephalastrum racemosum TaxID=13706 RepID=A0A1X2HRW6_SYNRA|nr:Fcf1-domain-containing protein [Syncephalastrum racemosum]
MRPKRQHLYRRVMHTYGMTFGFRKPYQVLMDASFCEEAVRHHIRPQHDVTEVLQDQTKLFVTECVLQELRSKGEDENVKAIMTAKRCERRRCPHTAKPIPSAECLADVVGETNKFRYCVATQDLPLAQKLRAIPGVPIIHFQKTVLVLEALSKATKQYIENNTREKTAVPAKEAERLQSAKLIQEEDKPVHKKRKVKGPNPLSAKKKTRLPDPPKKKEKRKSEETDGKDTKKRKRTKKTKKNSGDAAQSNATTPDTTKDA